MIIFQMIIFLRKLQNIFCCASVKSRFRKAETTWYRGRFTSKYAVFCALAAICRFGHIRYVCFLNANLAKNTICSPILSQNSCTMDWFVAQINSAWGKMRKLLFFDTQSPSNLYHLLRSGVIKRFMLQNKYNVLDIMIRQNPPNEL